MPGKKVDVIEAENVIVTEDSRGIILYNDATNFVIQATTPWTGISSNAVGGSTKFFPAASSLGWLKVHYISSSTYGATGASCYIPVYRNLNTNLA